MIKDIENKIYEHDMFGMIGVDPPALSFPLRKKVGNTTYIVHMVYSFSDVVPGGFFLTPADTGEPEYMETEKALAVLGMKEGDFDRFKSLHEDPAKSLAGLPVDSIDHFYAAVEQGVEDPDIYAGYILELLPFIEPAGRRYYRAFL